MYPSKLKKDAIVEALCEIRFETSLVQEVFIGKLSNADFLKGFDPKRLNMADIPQAIRDSEPNLKYLPYLSFNERNGPAVVKLGSNVISYHIVGQDKYIGWQLFGERLKVVVNSLFDLLDIKVTRIGFRYVNAINADDHHIKSLYDLNFKIEVAGRKLDNLNLNYFIKNDDSHTTMVRTASSEFVQGKLPEKTIGVIDIDVFTPSNFECHEKELAFSWIEKAHSFEKEAFFSMFPQRVIKLLENENG